MHHQENNAPRSQRGTTQRRTPSEPRPSPTETPGWASHDFLVLNQRPDLTHPQPNPPQQTAHRWS